MAEKVIQKVEDELNCSVCLDTYTDPKQLQCFHVFCRKCLVRLVDRDQQGQLTLSCPTCRQVTPVPANGVAGLQPAFLLTHFLDIMEEHKKAATDPTANGERVERDTTSPAPCNKIKVFCDEHVGKEVELYCETCEEPICFKCAIKGGKHQSHDYEELDKAFEKYKVDITASLEPMEKQLATIGRTLAQLDVRCGEIPDQQAAIEANLHHTFTKLHQVLDARKTKLIYQLHQLTQDKLKSLGVQRDQLETTQARLNSCLRCMRDSLTVESQGEVLLMKSAVVRQVKELTIPFPPDTLKPIEDADMAFSVSADFATVCENYGQVLATGPLDPSKCHATGKGLEAAVVGESSTAFLHNITHKGHPFTLPVQSSECELVSEITGIRIRGHIERRGESHYQISYQPTIKGRHQLHIRVEGQHIRGSPFNITVTLPVDKLGTPILAIGGMKDPIGMAINQRGEVVVTDQRVHCVSVFSASGERLRSFGTCGSGQGQFESPCGVAVDAEGKILVVDCDNHRIQKFTAAGQFLTAVGTKGRGPLQFQSPEGITLNTMNNKVYVTDSGNNHVLVLNSDLTHCSTFGTRGTGQGQFGNPAGIACDSTGNVYVADFKNHCIQVFTAEGRFLRMFGGRGEARGKLKGPTGVAIDTSDTVYICEGENTRVSVFTSEGGFQTTFGTEGKQPGQFEWPSGVCVDSSGVVYVCDQVKNCIQIF